MYIHVFKRMKYYFQCTFITSINFNICHSFDCTCLFVKLVELDVSRPVIDCDTVKISFSSNGRTQCQLDDGSFTNCNSPYSQSGLRQGEHTVIIRVTDGRGGYKQQSVTFTIILGIEQHLLAMVCELPIYINR